MGRLPSALGKINIAGPIRTDEPMAAHTTFRAGGPADIFASPATPDDVTTLLRFASEEALPWFVLGGGANILVADAGIRGLVIDMTQIDSIRLDGQRLCVGAGLPISDASAYAADRGLGGLEFIYSMPGSVGGAVWMNARCYDADIFGILEHVDLVTPAGERERYLPRASEFDYKRSPFMDRPDVMVEVAFRLHPDDRERLWTEMRAHEADRRSKGHFDAPCAGSVFKNNRAFGRPSGAIIDSLGLRGFAIGGARVSDRHANIVVNAGGASASDIRSVIRHIHDRVLTELGMDLEEEVLYVGAWQDAQA